MVYVYFIIGIIMFTFSGARIVAEDEEYIKKPHFWIITGLLIIIWPIVVALAIYNVHNNTR